MWYFLDGFFLDRLEDRLRSSAIPVNQYGLQNPPFLAFDWLTLPTRIEHRARELLPDLRGTGHLAGRNPCGIAAACLYAAAKEVEYPLTQKRAAVVADVTPVTVRATYRVLSE